MQNLINIYKKEFVNTKKTEIEIEMISSERKLKCL